MIAGPDGERKCLAEAQGSQSSLFLSFLCELCASARNLREGTP